MAQAVVAGDAVERAARVGDYHELLGPGELLEVAVVRQRLDRAARFGGHDEQRLLDVDRVLDAQHDVWVGRVEHRELEPVRDVAERAPDHLRPQRGAAHAEQDRVGEAVGPRLVGELVKLRRMFEHRLGHR